MTGVETALDGGAHDAERLSGEGLRTRPELQVRKQRLLSTLCRQERRRDRDVLRRTGAAARLRVEERRFLGQRPCAGSTLLLDVRAEHLVVLHGNALTKLIWTGDVGETVRRAEARIAVGQKQPSQRPTLRIAWAIGRA